MRPPSFGDRDGEEFGLSLAQAEALRLFRLQDDTPPADRRFVHLLREEVLELVTRQVLASAPIAAQATPTAGHTPVGVVAWSGAAERSKRRGVLAGLAMAAVLLVALTTGYVTFRLVAPSSSTKGLALDPPQPFSLYVTDGDPSSRRFVQLDATTLADVPNRTPIEFDAPYGFVVSGDGSTAVSLTDQTEDGWVIVRDGRTRQERTRFQLSIKGDISGLSFDGSRVLIRGIGGKGAPQSLYVFSTADGTLLTTFQFPTIAGAVTRSWLMDPAGRRLYWLVLPETEDRSVPRTLRIYAYDLMTGGEVGLIDLPDVLWGRYRHFGNALDEFTPAVALSADGRQLAVVHADSMAVTLIDTGRLAVERTLTLSNDLSAADALLGLIPLWPQSASAKEAGEIGVRQAVFGPDGRTLYVFGWNQEADQEGHATHHDLGILKVDTQKGTIVADALEGQRVERVLLSPDGEAIYAVTMHDPNGPEDPTGMPTYVLHRLDGETLTPTARREFEVFPNIMIVRTG